LILSINPAEDIRCQASNAVSFFLSNQYLEIVGERGSGKTRILAQLVQLHLMSGGTVGICCHDTSYRQTYQRLATNEMEAHLIGWYPISRVLRGGVDRIFEEVRRRRQSLIVFDEVAVGFRKNRDFGFGVACAYTPASKYVPKTLRERVLEMIT
jgi:ABC-type branched-subunit amino acid transport system ATPase component